MRRHLHAYGLLTIAIGVALAPPVVIARLEGGNPSSIEFAIITASFTLIACGSIAVAMGYWHPKSSAIPSGARTAIVAAALFAAFFALEFSDRLVQRKGQLVYWSTFLFPVAMALFIGLVGATRWSWYLSRAVAICSAAFFVLFLLAIPFVPLQAEGVPVPWYGRVYMGALTIAFAGICGLAYWSLGHSETRAYFQLKTSEPAP